MDTDIRSSCLFCKIADKKINAAFVHEDEDSFSIRDINPQAPTHILIIPRQHLESIAHAMPQDSVLLGKLFGKAAAIALKEGIEKGFRLVVNTGEDGGQTVGHLHIHLLAGRPLLWPPG